MISRPLDLASRLRPAPRNFDFWFWVNIGLMLLAFSLLGSRFVLAPGLGVDFQLPEMAGATAGAVLTTHDVAVDDAGLIMARQGSMTLKVLSEWLNEEAKITKHPRLLVRASGGVTSGELIKIVEVARAAGFEVTLAANESARAGATK